MGKRAKLGATTNGRTANWSKIFDDFLCNNWHFHVRRFIRETLKLKTDFFGYGLKRARQRSASASDLGRLTDDESRVAHVRWKHGADSIKIPGKVKRVQFVNKGTRGSFFHPLPPFCPPTKTWMQPLSTVHLIVKNPKWMP